jgi:hypothetical protein
LRGGGRLTARQLSEWDQIAFFETPDVYHRTPDSGELLYKSGGSKRYLLPLGGLVVDKLIQDCNLAWRWTQCRIQTPNPTQGRVRPERVLAKVCHLIRRNPPMSLRHLPTVDDPIPVYSKLPLKPAVWQGWVRPEGVFAKVLNITSKDFSV